MILQEQDIKNIILSPVPEWIEEAREASRVLNVHLNKNGVAEHLNQITNYENSTQYDLRKRFAQSNKAVFTNLLRPIDKIFTAKGGSKTYDVPTESKEKLLMEKLNDLRHGLSITKWIKKVHMNKYYTDPSGIVFFTVNADGTRTWPTLKSIDVIRNYESEGRMLEWLLFEGVVRKDEVGEPIDGLFFRFIDDAFDYVFHVNGDDIEEMKDERKVNNWKKVPAIMNSDIMNPNLKCANSPLDEVVELADKYMTTNSVKNIYEFLHGYPIFWMYVKHCALCKGEGVVSDEDDHEVNCGRCSGTGLELKKDVSDAILLQPPTEKDQPTLAPDVAGYVQPDLETWREQRTELDWIWSFMHFTMWGTSYANQGENEKTATESFLNVQPVNDRLGDFSDACEDLEKKMTDFVGQFYLKESYKGCSINYGRRYMMESPDKVWEKYIKAKNSGAPRSSLDHLLNQYYQSEFMNDPENLVRMLKGMGVEPFIHATIEQILGYKLEEEDYKMKLFFGEWWKDVKMGDVLKKTVEQLREELRVFILTKTIKQDEESSDLHPKD